jgi:phosphoglucosamine mutase
VLPLAFSPAAREVAVIAGEPDGARINVGCGSTAPEYLKERYREFGGTVGLAFDGDADRLIAVDEEGETVDGDVILALLATWLQGRGELAPSALALTVMSNGGVRDYLAARGIETVETKVGDRYVIEAMRERGIQLGGEQSGHIIYRRAATTGDGLATGILLLSALAELQVRLADFRRQIPRYPQRLRSVRVGDRDEALRAQAYTQALADAEVALRGVGRVLVRPSGTEPVVRVMVEAHEAAVADQWLERLCAALGGH